jgi:matrixin
LTTVATDVGAPDGRGGRTLFVGQLLDADILFNPKINFSTAGGSNQDLQTVSTHEVGHFFGLSHSAVVRAMMFPFAPSLLTTLSYDDVAGISTLYPAGSPVVPTTNISGTVRLNNAAVFGAHVFADSQTQADPFGGFNIRKTPIGTLTLPDGTYSIQGVPADVYRIAAEPLDLPVENGDVSGYASAFGQGAVQTNFTTRWH